MKEKPKKYPELPGVKTLLEKVRDGDKESFDPIYDFYKGRVVGYVRAKNYADPESAEDTAQEVFLRAYLALKRGVLVPRDELGNYLITVARNHMIDVHKVKRNLPNAESGIESSRDDVPQTAENNIELGKTLNSIAKLPPLERAIVKESAFSSQRQVAQTVGESENVVHNRLHDIRMKLREEVGRPRRIWPRGQAGFI